jgi:hypothetical protein
MDRPHSILKLEAGSAELEAAVVTVGRCLDAWHGYVGALVSRPVIVPVRISPASEVTDDDEGIAILLPESLIGSPALTNELLLAALEAVEVAGRRWPHEKPRRLWRDKTTNPSDDYATDRALEDLSPGELLLLARPEGDNGDTIDDYLEEVLAEAGIAEPTRSAAGNGFNAWVLAPLDD